MEKSVELGPRNAPVTDGDINDFTMKYTPLIREAKISDFLKIEKNVSVTLITSFIFGCILEFLNLFIVD